MKRIVLTVLSLFIALLLAAQETWPSYVSTRHYGPFAFPVPDILTGTTDRLECRMDATLVAGQPSCRAGNSASLGFAVRVPLWTERVNFSVWGQLWEFYRGGSQFADIYFSTEANLLPEKGNRPGISARAACKTASSNSGDDKRFYDAPGYFFDASLSKHFSIGRKNVLAVAASSGFLCWQVKDHRQNDAVMYGISVAYEYDGKFGANLDFGGYSGWRNDGDDPMSLKFRISCLNDRMVSPYVDLQHGFRDWPFDWVRLGVKVSLDL